MFSWYLSFDVHVFYQIIFINNAILFILLFTDWIELFLWEDLICVGNVPQVQCTFAASENTFVVEHRDIYPTHGYHVLFWEK